MTQAVVNAVAYIGFTLTDSVNAAVTGKVNTDFTKNAVLLSNTSTTATATVAEIGSGRYEISFTPTATGDWYVTWSVTVDADTVRFEETVDVITAAQSTFATATGADYCTLAQLKARMGVTDTASDSVYNAVITAASRAIDAFCGRRFYQLAATARYFTAEHGSLLEVDDLVSVTSIAVDVAGVRDYSVTFQTTDYDLLPDNASDVGWPYTAIAIQPFSSEWFPTLRRGVKITGTWGWPAVPTDVTEACLLLAQRLAKRPAAPYGGGTADFGGAAVITPVDADLIALLSGYRSMRMGAV